MNYMYIFIKAEEIFVGYNRFDSVILIYRFFWRWWFFPFDFCRCFHLCFYFFREKLESINHKIHTEMAKYKKDLQPNKKSIKMSNIFF